MLIEFKPSNNKDAKETVIKTIDLIEKYDFSDKAMFMSLNKDCVEYLSELRPDWWIGYCAFGNLGQINLRLNDKFIPDFIAIEESAINTQLLESARNNVLPIYVWTVDDDEKILDYLRMGVSGIIGDSSENVSNSVIQYRKNYNKDDYLTVCPGFPQLLDDESGYVECK